MRERQVNTFNIQRFLYRYALKYKIQITSIALCAAKLENESKAFDQGQPLPCQRSQALIDLKIQKVKNIYCK